ncbi:MAG: hypothetical protein ACE5WD_00880 [Candidatus Aminicenantia bacterium]
MTKISMTETKKASNYDLEERTYQFAKNIALFCKKLPRTISNREYIKQVIGLDIGIWDLFDIWSLRFVI